MLPFGIYVCQEALFLSVRSQLGSHMKYLPSQKSTFLSKFLLTVEGSDHQYTETSQNPLGPRLLSVLALFIPCAYETDICGFPLLILG